MAKKKIIPVVPKKTLPDFPIVGIGASAGGLSAFEAFFSGMPPDTEPGMAFVLVQHLAPDHKSILVDLVKRYTRMQVFEVEDGMSVQINCTYIIPPNYDMAFLNGSLQLLNPASPRGQRLPIDFFFRSLAQDLHERAIGIILSGTGSDGTLGVRAIKGEGGMVMAQNPESTEYDGMPRSVISTGLVDFIMPPAEMGAQLISYRSIAYGKLYNVAEMQIGRFESALKKIFVLLRAQSGHDFSQYKPNTILRRVERRMAVHQINHPDRYVNYLQRNPLEIEALFSDLLIGVTSFFRDEEAFSVLKLKVIPELFESKQPGDLVRIWVPGCSTGEEAYSIAILMMEYIESSSKNLIVQIFATDVDHKAIEHARSGKYHESVVADITPRRLARFFSHDEEDKVYRIQKVIRDMVVFSEQDIIKDPPFSKLDMISCRNVLIYMNGDLQKKLIPLFHYSINPGGVLFLGNSESTGEFIDLFSVLNRKWKMFRRMDHSSAHNRPSFDKLFPLNEKETEHHPPALKKNTEFPRLLSELAEKELLLHFKATGVITSNSGDILYIHGHTGKYLEPSHGMAGMNIVKMAREGLKQTLSMALGRTVSTNTISFWPGLNVKTNGEYSVTNLTIRPLTSIEGNEVKQKLFLVILEDAAEGKQKSGQKSPKGKTVNKNAGLDDRFKELEQALKDKEEYLQSTLEEMETSNEELKSTNEELQSVNEELQSTNEELETSKEELQSVNEELSTVNNEFQTKLTDLTRVNNDMNNLMAGTGIGTIFVDLQLNVFRFTPAATVAVNLISTDIGRPLHHIVSNFSGYTALVEDVKKVLQTLIPKELEVVANDMEWYLLRIFPYRTIENVIEGAVITIVKITELKNMQKTIAESEKLRHLAVIIRDSNDAIIVCDLTGQIIAWNPGAERIYGWSETEALKMNLQDITPVEFRKIMIKKVIEHSQKEEIKPFNGKRLTKQGLCIDVSIVASQLINNSGQPYAISTIERRTSNE